MCEGAFASRVSVVGRAERNEGVCQIERLGVSSVCLAWVCGERLVIGTCQTHIEGDARATRFPLRARTRRVRRSGRLALGESSCAHVHVSFKIKQNQLVVLYNACEEVCPLG